MAGVLLAALTVTACAGIGTSAVPSHQLEGTSWTLVEMNEREPAGEPAPTLAFDDAGNISGSAGCNTYTAIAAFDGNSIAFGSLATTQMACPGVTGLQEAAFLQAMNDVQTYAIDSQGHLVLNDGVVLIFDAD